MNRVIVGLARALARPGDVAPRGSLFVASLFELSVTTGYCVCSTASNLLEASEHDLKNYVDKDYHFWLQRGRAQSSKRVILDSLGTTLSKRRGSTRWIR